MGTHYTTLGIPEDANGGRVKAAYREKVKVSGMLHWLLPIETQQRPRARHVSIHRLRYWQ